MANDNSRKFKQNQLVFFIPFLIIPNSRCVDFVEDRLREWGSLPAPVSYTHLDVYKRQGLGLYLDI